MDGQKNIKLNIKGKYVFFNYKHELLRMKLRIFSELSLHRDHLRAEIYRERSGEDLPEAS